MIYLFGDCRLDTQLYTLQRGAQTTRLPPRVFKVLHYLLEQRDRVVSKDELCAQVWPDQFIANTTLEGVIRLVRRATGDTGQTQRIIQTSHGYGYRFVAPVEQRSSDADQAPAVRPIAPQAPHPERVLSPFVGRQQELAMLHERLEQVESGHGRAVGLVGHPGAGKSRPFYEFRQSLRSGRVTYLEGWGFSNRHSMPYLPWLDIVRQNCGIMAEGSAEAVTAQVSNHLREMGMDPEERTPYLLRLLGIKSGEDKLTALKPNLIRVRIATTLCHMLLASSRQRPVIATIEDLQWIDSASEDCLVSLMTNLAHAPILLLTTCHPEYRPAWMETSVVTQMTLAPLTARESLRMFHAGLAQTIVTADLEQNVVTKAAGNPLLLEELTRLIIEHEAPGPDTTLPDNV